MIERQPQEFKEPHARKVDWPVAIFMISLAAVAASAGAEHLTSGESLTAMKALLLLSIISATVSGLGSTHKFEKK